MPPSLFWAKKDGRICKGTAGKAINNWGVFMNFGKTRGQAFDTMMLVISVLVAMAILAVLMNVLNSLNFNPNSAKEIMKTELKSIVTSGYGTSSPKQVEFKKDEYIDIKSVLGDASVSEGEVQFKCGSQSTELCSGGDSPLVIDDAKSTGSITVNKNTKAYVVVCGDDSKGEYCISVGRQGADARQTCTETCLR